MNFNYMYNGGTDYIVESAISGVFMIYGIFVVVYGLVSLASYILRAIGFYTIGKHQGDDNAWLAFVPVVRKYQQGQLAGDILLKNKALKNVGIWFVGLPVAWGILSYLISMVMGMSVVGNIIRYGITSSYNGYGTDLEDIIEGLLGFFVIYVIIAVAYQVIYTAFTILVDKSILEKYTTGNMPVIHAVFSAMVPLYEAICVFIISRRIESDGEKKHRTENTYYNTYERGEFSRQGMNQQNYAADPVPQQVMNEGTPQWQSAPVSEQAPQWQSAPVSEQAPQWQSAPVSEQAPEWNYSPVNEQAVVNEAPEENKISEE